MYNVYTPNHASAHAIFCSQILESLPSANTWCIGEDFNMIEAPEDQCGGSKTMVYGSELATWESLCMALWLEDARHHTGYARGNRNLHFSRFDRWAGGTNLLRIDRMYISNDFGARGGTIEILARTCMSNHFPVMLVTHEDIQPSSISLRIPESMQTYEQLSDRTRLP